MARELRRLTALEVSKAKAPGRYADGGGLYLAVTQARDGKGIRRSWIFRYALDGRSREMGLGSLTTTALREAREKADACRKLLRDCRDPLDARESERAAAAREAARSKTFDQCAEACIASLKAGWKNAKHAEQWQNTLKTYASPILGDKPVHEIDTEHVSQVIEPLWTTKTETAKRLRGRMEAVLDWAIARGHREGPNPALWRGRLNKLLAEPGKVRRVKHHAALKYEDAADFMAQLRKREGNAARALEFAILTAARTSEALGARWNEIDLDAGVWTIPAERIKAGKQHRVPLSGRALAILTQMHSEAGDDAAAFVFPGAKRGRPLSGMVFLMLLRRMGRDDLTAHGFRSTFRDWAAETTNYPREVAEMALAHAIPDETERAYRRGDLFEKRRRLMAEWAKFCDIRKTRGAVVPIGGSRQGQTPAA